MSLNYINANTLLIVELCVGLTISSWAGKFSEEVKQVCEDMISDGWNYVGVLQIFC